MGRYAVDWRGADLRAGDAIVLALDTYHMTACNLTREARLSCDTRWCAPAGACGFLTLAAHIPAGSARTVAGMLGSRAACRRLQVRKALPVAAPLCRCSKEWSACVEAV